MDSGTTAPETARNASNNSLPTKNESSASSVKRSHDQISIDTVEIEKKMARWRNKIATNTAKLSTLKALEANILPILQQQQEALNEVRQQIIITQGQIYNLATYVQDTPLQIALRAEERERRWAQHQEQLKQRAINLAFREEKERKIIEKRQLEAKNAAAAQFQRQMDNSLGPNGLWRIDSVDLYHQTVTLILRQILPGTPLTNENSIVIDKGEGYEDHTSYHLTKYLEHPSDEQTFEVPPPDLDPEAERKLQAKIKGDAKDADARNQRARRFLDPPPESNNVIVIRQDLDSNRPFYTDFQLPTLDTLPAQGHPNPRLAMAFNSSKAQTRMIEISDAIVSITYLERDYDISKSTQHHMIWTGINAGGFRDYHFETIQSPQAIPIYSTDILTCQLLYLMNDWSAWMQFKTLEPTIQLVNQLHNHFEKVNQRTKVTLECLKVNTNKFWTGMIAAEHTMQLSYYSEEPFIGTKTPPNLLAQFQITVQPEEMTEFLMNANVDLISALQSVNALAESIHKILLDYSFEKDLKVWNAMPGYELLACLAADADLSILAEHFGGPENTIRRIAKIRPDILHHNRDKGSDNYSLVYDILGNPAEVRTSKLAMETPLVKVDEVNVARQLYDANKHGYRAPLLDPNAQRTIAEKIFMAAAANRDANHKAKHAVPHVHPDMLKHMDSIQPIQGPLRSGESDPDP